MATLVVGGMGGIGRAICDRLASEGREIVVLDRAQGIDACDLAAVSAFLETQSPIDTLVFVAGSVGAGGIEDHTTEQWRSVLDDNLTAAFVTVKATLSTIRAQRGSIVLMSSVMARTGGNRLSGPAYASAKAGIIGLTRHLARDLAADGVRVNAVAPGPVDTPMVHRLDKQALQNLLDTVPLHRVAHPNEIASAIAYLLSADAASVTGVVLDINGGMAMS
jgi:3-oxoacyl-[acyl-carrier protein] reductase